MGLHSHSIVQNDNLYLLFLIIVHLSSSFLSVNPEAIQKMTLLRSGIKLTLMKKNTGTFCAVFDESTTLWEIDQFVDKFRQETDKKDEFVIDLNLSKTGSKVFLAKYRKKEIYH